MTMMSKYGSRSSTKNSSKTNVNIDLDTLAGRVEEIIFDKLRDRMENISIAGKETEIYRISLGETNVGDKRREEYIVIRPGDKECQIRPASALKNNPSDDDSHESKNSKSPSRAEEAIHEIGEITNMPYFSHLRIRRSRYNIWLWKSLAWLVLLLICMVYTVYTINDVVQDYLTYPMTTQVVDDNNVELDFPAITVCNCNEIQDSPTRPIHDYVLSCAFNYEDCETNELNRMGNSCFTFNLNKKRQLKQGEDGFRLIFNIQCHPNDSENHSVYTCANVKIFPSGTPQPYSPTSLLAPPGAHTDIMLSKTQHVIQDPPTGTCFDAAHKKMRNKRLNLWHDKYDYSQLACQHSCNQTGYLQFYQACHDLYDCDPQLPHLPVWKKTDFNDSNKNSAVQGFSESCYKQCLPECTQTRYQPVISTAEFPSYSSVKNPPQQFKEMVDKFHIDNDTDRTYANMRRSLVSLRVTFETTTVKKFTSSPKYNFNNLMSNIGGQLGLFTGFSFLTMIQLFEIFLYVCVGQFLQPCCHV